MKWELITEVKDSGYYIGWKRVHPNIHDMLDSPASKTSIVQIGGSKQNYEVRGLTYAHSVFAKVGTAGTKLFDETSHFKSLMEARIKANALKKQIAKQFDKLTRSPEFEQTIALQGVKTEHRKILKEAKA